MARPEETVSPPRGGPTAAGAGDAAWGPMESDPRRPGLHYMVLIATRTEGARRLAAFCRARGLETYVVGGNNERLRCVVVLPGVPTQSRSDPQVRRLMDRVDPVCRAWKDENPREGELHDRYLQLYQP